MVLRKRLNLTSSISIAVLASAAITAPARDAGASPASGARAPLQSASAALQVAAAAPARGGSQGSKRPSSAQSGQTPAPTAQPARPGAPDRGAEEKPPPALVKKARDLWYRGVEAFRNGNYEAARQAFAECYRLMPKSDVLRNLSISEIHSGHYVSAARHLTQLLAAPGDLPPDVRQEATTRLAQAEAQIGQLGIEVDVPGADIRVDGASIGRSPLEGNWYVEPGQHEIVILKPGYPAERRQVFALVGVTIPVEVSLEARRREQASDALAAELMGTSEGQAPVRIEGRDGLSTGSTIALAALGTVAAVGLAGGIVYTLAADDHDEEAEKRTPFLSGAVGCDSPPAEFVDDCAIVKRERDAALSDRRLAAAGFIGFGVASAAFLGYALWLALDDNEIDPADALGFEPALSVGPLGASIGISAEF